MTSAAREVYSYEDLLDHLPKQNRFIVQQQNINELYIDKLAYASRISKTSITVEKRQSFFRIIR